MNLNGASIVVTGSGRGIGAAIAKKVVKAGGRVVINYRVNEAAATKTMSEINQIRSDSCILCRADVRLPVDVDHLIRTCVDQFGGLDALVNNAHTEFTPKPYRDLTWDDVIEQIDGSLKTVFLCTLAAMEHLSRSERAAVLNISTVLVTDPASNMSVRMAAKGSVEALTRSLAFEYSPKKIRVNALSVGWTDTDQLQVTPIDILRRAVNNIPLGRVANPDEIAEAAVFLLSDSASYITGTIFPVAGGFSTEFR